MRRAKRSPKWADIYEGIDALEGDESSLECGDKAIGRICPDHDFGFCWMRKEHLAEMLEIGVDDVDYLIETGCLVSYEPIGDTGYYGWLLTSH